MGEQERNKGGTVSSIRFPHYWGPGGLLGFLYSFLAAGGGDAAGGAACAKRAAAEAQTRKVPTTKNVFMEPP